MKTNIASEYSHLVLFMYTVLMTHTSVCKHMCIYTCLYTCTYILYKYMYIHILYVYVINNCYHLQDHHFKHFTTDYLLPFFKMTHSSILTSPIQPLRSDQIRSVTQLCPTLCDLMNPSTPGLPVHHQLPEFAQTHVHRVSDAIQPSHPLSSLSPPAPNPSQHQSLFQ